MLPTAYTVACRAVRTAAAALAVLPACATYPQRTAAAMWEFEHGNFAAAEESYADTDVTGSAFLSGAEAGMAAMAAGDWAAALEHLQRAVDEAREIEDRALVSATDLGEGLLTWVVNESARTYQGEGFERVMLHATLALAYLATGAVDDVWVEARLANQILEREEELYEKDYRAGKRGSMRSMPGCGPGVRRWPTRPRVCGAVAKRPWPDSCRRGGASSRRSSARRGRTWARRRSPMARPSSRGSARASSRRVRRSGR
jgi:hypothetical protein